MAKRKRATSPTTLTKKPVNTAPPPSTAKSRSGAMAKSDQPNILVIWGDDIGQSNLSCYTHGLMGYRTPNIDRIAKEGMLFTDSLRRAVLHRRALVVHHRAERLSHRPFEGRHSRRAGRHVREARHHRRAAQGAGLRHRPVRQEPPRRPEPACCRPTTASTSSSATSTTSTPKKSRRWTTIRRRRTSRTSARTSDRAACIHSWATDKDDPTEMPRWGKVGKQKIEDTGPLNKKRMETCDDEFVAAATDFIKRQNKAGKPFFVWLNTTHMHLFTHTKTEEPRPGRALAVALPRHDDRPRQERRPDARPARRARHRRRHLRACTRPTTGRTGTPGRTAA